MIGMSSDVRIKKLRGSGGYVIASVTDEEQRKGNFKKCQFNRRAR